MAKKFKDYYDLDCAVLLADNIKAVWPEFNKTGFVARLKDELADKDFLDRQDAFVDAFEVYMPDNYEKLFPSSIKYSAPNWKPPQACSLWVGGCGLLAAI